ncbi:MAG TPA: arginine deiminase family protein [Bryobacteraceae bacterium]|nr:arginine deiminase family protein [Bryobacteraceae bacterium]
MLVAITRSVSPNLGRCELEYFARHPIDIALACEQHRRYERCLESLGARVISLPAEPDLPDSVFVEDPAVVLDEIAVITRMGVESRRDEAPTLAEALAPFRALHSIDAPGTLEGGDVIRIGRTLFVGLSHRTNAAGSDQLAAHLAPFGYNVKPVPVSGCLHLKSAACSLGDDRILINRAWVDPAAFESFRLIDVPADEPWAANVLPFGGTVLCSAAFPATRVLLDGAGYRTMALDVSELAKAEGALTCSSLIFRAKSPGAEKI